MRPCLPRARRAVDDINVYVESVVYDIRQNLLHVQRSGEDEALLLPFLCLLQALKRHCQLIAARNGLSR